MILYMLNSVLLEEYNRSPEDRVLRLQEAKVELSKKLLCD